MYVWPKNNSTTKLHLKMFAMKVRTKTMRAQYYLILYSAVADN